MKKIIYILLTAVLALSFMGCPTTYDDVEYDQYVPTVQYIQGDMAGSAAAMEVNGLVATYTFTYDETMTAWGSSLGTITFKVAAVEAGGQLDWPNAWSDATLTLNGEAVFTESKNGGNNTCEGLTVGEDYTITVTSGLTGVSIAITGKAPEATVELAEPDLSAINATTMAQAGAYISINGDAWSDATVGKYFFNKKGDSYVAIIPFDIPEDAANGWGDTAYQAWGKIGVGDNKTLKVVEKQFSYVDDELIFKDSDHVNMDFDDIVNGSKGVITVTASADGCTCVATVY